MGVYSKLIVMVVGSILSVLSRWIPGLEGANPELLVEAIALAITAFGVYAVPNKP